MKKLLLFILIFCFVSCDKSKSDPKNPIEEDVLTDTVVVQPETTEQKIALFLKRKADVTKKLRHSNKEEANALYLEYEKENNLFLEQLMLSESSILENYYSEDIAPEFKKAKIDLLKKGGLEFWEIGEGYVEIRTQNDFYDALFQSYVTADYKEYLKIKREEERTLYAADAGLVITFRELGDRIVQWERFIERHPKSDLIQSIKENHKSYQMDYLTGMDNTPTIDTQKNELYPENSEEFNFFLKKYPDSPTSQLIKIFLEHYKESGDKIYQVIKKEQDRQWILKQ